MTGNLRLIVFAGLLLIVIVMWVMAYLSKEFEEVAGGIAALPAARFEQLTGVAVGTGGTFENHLRSGPAIAFGLGRDVILVDAGRGVAEALRKTDIPVWQPAHVVITELLPENTVGLDDLWLTGWVERREAPLQILGPRGTAQLVEQLRAAHGESAGRMAERWELPVEGGLTPVQEIDEPTERVIGGMTLRLEPLGDGLAARIEAGPHAMAVAPRSHEPERLAAFADGVDWLWAGAVYGASLEAAAEAGADHIEVLQREAAEHFRLEDVGGLAAKARARGLVLVRLRPPPVFPSQYRNLVGETYRGAVVIAEDGEQITP